MHPMHLARHVLYQQFNEADCEDRVAATPMTEGLVTGAVEAPASKMRDLSYGRSMAAVGDPECTSIPLVAVGHSKAAVPVSGRESNKVDIQSQRDRRATRRGSRDGSLNGSLLS